MRKALIAFTLVSSNAFALKQISPTECSEMQKKVGQLFYVNVDGFGSKSVVDPAYEKLIKKIQPGGVLPHYNSQDIEGIRKASLKLQEQSDLPLMIGIDYQSMNGAVVGLGYGSGLAAKITNPDVACFEKVAKIEAALHQYAGINNPLGPTIEYNTKDKEKFPAKPLDYRLPRLKAIVDAFRDAGLETTLKHFPYTPSDYNLHKTSKDTKIPLEEVNRDYMPIYNQLADNSGFVMTTHLYNSEVDPANMATFSKVWMKKLREEVGFKGIAMTDALFMIDSYPDTMKQMSRDWPSRLSTDFNKDLTIFTVKSILAGHDMVFLETAAKETEKTWSDVARFACTDDPLAKDFRKRVRESYDRIKTYKKANQQLKDNTSKLTPEDIKVLLSARKSASDVCNSTSTKLDAILQKIKRPKTKIDESIFKCDPIDAGTSPFSQELKTLNENITDASVALVIKGALAGKPDDLNATIKFLNENPQAREAVKTKLIAKAQFAKPEATDAINALGKLDLFGKDTSVLKAIMDRNDMDAFENYLKMERGSKIVPLDETTPLTERIKFFKEYAKSHPIDLATNSLRESLALIETLFPSESYYTLDEDAVKALDLQGDYSILFKFRNSESKGFSLSEDEQVRILEILSKNTDIEKIALPRRCPSEKTSDELCGSNISLTENLDGLISFSNLNIPPEKKQMLDKGFAKMFSETKNPNLKVNYQIWKVKTQNNKTVTLNALSSAADTVINLLKSKNDDMLGSWIFSSMIQYGASTDVRLPKEKKDLLFKEIRRIAKAKKGNISAASSIAAMFSDELKEENEILEELSSAEVSQYNEMAED